MEPDPEPTAHGKATTTKQIFSRETTIGISIDAAPAIVWALLTHASDYTRWNATVLSLTGDIREGGTVELQSILDERRTFKLKIKVFEPEKRLVWGDSKGERVFTLVEVDGGTGTLFTMTEKFGGLLFPLYGKYFPPFDESFEQFAADLKREAEAMQNAAT